MTSKYNKEVIRNGVKLILDPLNKYEHISSDYILALLGEVPGWCINPAYMDKNLYDALDAQYMYGGISKDTGFTIDEDGIMRFPGDPDQYPFVKIIRKDEILYQYPHGMVGFIDSDGKAHLTRMD